jgi:quinol-cytochrome oxidoreductase complex cytochrome b subunit
MNLQNVKEEIVRTQVWRSILRHRYTETNRNKSLTIFSNVFLHVLPVKVRVKTLSVWYSMGPGIMSFWLFLLLVVTGLLLMFYYHPSVPQAYQDMIDMEFVVASGAFLRNLHRWSGHAMVLLVFIHMVHVFYRGDYKPPRQFNWVIGVFLLLLTLLLSYTGYLLPWDQLAFWAITVGTNMMATAPLIGPQSKFLLLGGNLIGENALLRFYVLHCFVLPLAVVLFVSVHFWRVRKDGGILE